MYRDTENGWIAGICAGLGAKFGFDPFWARAAWVLLTLVGGSGILFYLIFWLLLPDLPNGSPDAEQPQRLTWDSASDKFRQEVERIRQNFKNKA